MTPTETQAAPTEAQRLAELKWLADEAKSLVFNAGQPCEYEHIRMPRIQAAWDAINRLYCLATPSPVPPAEEPAAVPKGWKLVQGKAYGQRYVSLVEDKPAGTIIVNAYEQGSPQMFAFLSALASSAPGTVVGEDTERLTEDAEDLAKLRAFTDDVMGGWPEVGGLDGFDMQAIGERTGLLRRERREAPCGDHCSCVEFDSGEVECWRVEPVLQRARDAARAQASTGEQQ